VTEPLESTTGWPDRCLVWETGRPYIYIRETDDGRLMVGGEDEPCAECHRSASWFRKKVPIIGAHDDQPGIWYALGYGGNGISFSVIAAMLLRDAIGGRVNPDAEIFAGGLRVGAGR
jgi:glycine/D-amino acid oxidase-like deaminating enzyme